MAIRDHGFYACAFVVARPLQIIALGALVGMTGNFINQDSHAHFSAPSTVMGTLVISSITLFWTILSVTAYDDSHIPYWATAALDLLFAVPFVVGAAVLGGPLGGFDCSVLPTTERTTDLLAIQTKAATATSPAAYILFVGDSQTTCYQVMAIWGLALALCALFAVTGLATCLLYFGRRRSTVRVAPKTTAIISSRPVVRGPSPMMPIYRSEPGSIEMASATSKWLGSDEYDDDDRHDRSSVHGSLHGSVQSGLTWAESYHSPEQSPGAAAASDSTASTTTQLLAAPAYSTGRGASRLQRKRVPLRIQTVRRRPHRTRDGEDREEDSDGRGEEDDDDDDDEHSDDSIFGGGLTTPLSPPPQTHQTMYGLGGSNSTPNSGRASAASSRFNTPRTPLSPVFPGRSSPSPSTGRHDNDSFDGDDGDGGDDNCSSHSIFFPSPRSSSSFPLSSSRPTTSCSTPAGSSRPSGPSGPRAPPAPPAPLSQIVVTPIAGTALDTKTTPTPLLRELTPKHTSVLLAKYTPSNPLKRNLPASLSSLAPPLSPSGRAILWPLAYPLSPVRRQLDLSPISPILPPRPQPAAPRLDQRQDQRQQLLTHRKTLLQRIEGWWDLGLLRGGTIKGRGRPLAAINAVSAMASPRSEPLSAGSNSADMNLAGQLPAAFV
ncbi:MAG: hypothetical protein SEPTF4163_002911 [Sporothrix epigloea]